MTTVASCDFVLAQQQVGGARVVQVQERIVVIHAVQGEQVRSRGDAEAGEVAVTGTGVHDRTRGGLGDEAQVVAGVGNFRNFAGVEGGGDFRSLRLQQRSFAGDFYSGSLRADFQFGVDDRIRTDTDGRGRGGGLEVGGGNA